MQAYLEMWIGHALGNLLEEWFLYFIELHRIYHIKYLFDLSQEHHFLLAARLGPNLEQTNDDLLR